MYSILGGFDQQDWCQAVEANPGVEMCLEPEVAGRNPLTGQTLRILVPPLSAAVETLSTGWAPVFRFQPGLVTFAEEEAIPQARLLATALEAKLFGPDGVEI